MFSPTDVPFPDDDLIRSMPCASPIPDPLHGSGLRLIRYLTAIACLKLCTNHGDQDAIRKAFHIPGPYQPCPVCENPLDNKGQCNREHDEDQGAY